MSVNRALAWVGSAVAVAAVAAGLYIAGAPSDARLMRLDGQRVRDLQRLARAVDAYRVATGSLPSSLADTVKSERAQRLPVDPESGESYRYEVVSADAYRLCAQFARPSRKLPGMSFWEHGAGATCFEVPVNAAK